MLREVTSQRWRHTPRRLLRMRAAAYCSILHYAAGTEQAYGLGTVLDFSFRVLVPESKMIQAERAKFTNVSVPALIFLD